VIKTAVERQTHEVNHKRVIEHSNGLDVEFAPEIEGNENGRNGIVGPFEAIQGRFLSKTDYIVFCAGAFVEINEDGEKLSHKTFLAKIAAIRLYSN
jgi:hypothetical protein